MGDLLFNVGDTNFLCLVNKETYQSFIKEDWDLIKDLIPHVKAQQQLGNILMYQMTEEGIEDDWAIAYYVNEEYSESYLKKAENYIEVTNNWLHLIDYTCLTMAAQFLNDLIPDKECEPFSISIENGYYLVNTLLYKDVDRGVKSGNQEDLAFYFKKVEKPKNKLNKGIIWSGL